MVLEISDGIVARFIQHAYPQVPEPMCQSSHSPDGGSCVRYVLCDLGPSGPPATTLDLAAFNTTATTQDSAAFNTNTQR